MTHDLIPSLVLHYAGRMIDPQKTPVLYSFRRCPYAMRARLALAVSGVTCELREVVLRNKPEAMLAASPKGTVPVLVLSDGRVLEESLDIMIWALGLHDPEGWLAPDRAQMQKLIDLNDGPFKYHLDRYKYPNRYEGEPPADHRALGEDILKRLNTALKEQGHLLGRKPCLADFAILPFIRQFANTDRDWFDRLPYPALHQWLANFLESSLFQGIMKKYTPWEKGTQGILFPEA